MTEEEEVVELTEEKVELLQKAYKRPALGVMLDGIVRFEKSMEVKEVAPEEEVSVEEFSGSRSYAEYLRFFRAQEANAAEEEPMEEQAPEAGA